jgi:hypothetical protein
MWLKTRKRCGEQILGQKNRESEEAQTCFYLLEKIKKAAALV